MELNIKEKIAEIEMDIKKFKKNLRASLSLHKAIKNSVKIILDSRKLGFEKIIIWVYSETNWLFFLSLLKGTKKETIRFRIYTIEFKGMIRYSSDIRDKFYRYIKLTPKNVDGVDFIVMNNLISTPEAFFDFWLQKRVYNYANEKFNKIIFYLC